MHILWRQGARDRMASGKRRVSEMLDVKALTFDTGGTVLDWHGGMVTTLTRVGQGGSLSRVWPVLTNEYPRGALSLMPGHEHPDFNMHAGHPPGFRHPCAPHALHAIPAHDDQH